MTCFPSSSAFGLAVHDLLLFIVDRKAFTGLQPKEQKAIRDATAIAGPQQWKMEAAREAAALENLKQTGMQFDPLPLETRSALRRASAVVVDDARKRFGDKLLDAVLAATRPVVASRSSGH